MSRYPEHIRAAWFDGPIPPQLDRLTLAVQATEHALARVVEACSANPACAAAYPDIVSDWETGLRGLDAAPSLIRDEGLAVEVDAATAVRYLRNVFRQPGRVPLAVRDLETYLTHAEDALDIDVIAERCAGLRRAAG